MLSILAAKRERGPPVSCQEFSVGPDGERGSLDPTAIARPPAIEAGACTFSIAV
jgi:hypothetical protein